MNPLIKRILLGIAAVLSAVYILIYQGTKTPVLPSNGHLSAEQIRQLGQQLHVQRLNGSIVLRYNNQTLDVKSLAVNSDNDISRSGPLKCECHTIQNATVALPTPTPRPGLLQRIFRGPARKKRPIIVKKPNGPQGEPPPIPPHRANHTTLILMLSYQRSGSSFMGDLLNRNPSIFYVYEPLDALYSSLYGIPPGWSVPSDITGNKDGSVRKLPGHEIQATADTITNLLTCQLDKLPTEVLISQFWTQFWDHQTNVLDFTKCLHQHKVNVGRCQTLFLRRYCAPRVGIVASRDEKCRDMLSHPKAANPQSPQGKYLNCVLQRKDAAKECIPVLKDRCMKSEVRGAKTVRATMEMVEVLLQRHPNLKVLHLFRDPRPVMLSRFKHQSFRSYVSKKNLAIESKFYCGVVDSDIQIRKRLIGKYPNKIREIIYEEFVNDPLKQAGDIYKFLGIHFPKTVQEWLIKSTKKSSSIAAAWKDKIQDKDRAEMEGNCQSLFAYGSHVWEPVSSKR